MLDQELKQAYCKITPSPELEKKILSLQSSAKAKKSGKILSLKPMIAMAACLMLMLGGMTIINRLPNIGQTEIILASGAALGTNVSAVSPEPVHESIAMPRAMAAEPIAHGDMPTVLAIDLRISCGTKMVVETEDGMLQRVSNEGEDIQAAESVNKMILTGNDDTVTVRWLIPSTVTNDEYRLVIGDEMILLTYQADVDKYWISRTDVNN